MTFKHIGRQMSLQDKLAIRAVLNAVDLVRQAACYGHTVRDVQDVEKSSFMVAFDAISKARSYFNQNVRMTHSFGIKDASGAILDKQSLYFEWYDDTALTDRNYKPEIILGVTLPTTPFDNESQAKFWYFYVTVMETLVGLFDKYPGKAPKDADAFTHHTCGETFQVKLWHDHERIWLEPYYKGVAGLSVGIPLHKWKESGLTRTETVQIAIATNLLMACEDGYTDNFWQELDPDVTAGEIDDSYHIPNFHHWNQLMDSPGYDGLEQLMELYR